MPNKGSPRRLILSGIFSVLIHENKLFCQIQYCASPAQSMPKTGLRAKRRFLRSARKTQPRLRAKWRFLGFARKTQPSVTGKNGDFWDLPVKHSPRLRAKWRFLGFARRCSTPRQAFLPNFVYHRLKIRLPRRHK